MEVAFSDIKKRIAKDTVERGFNELENMGLGKVIKSRSTNNRSLISFRKYKIKQETHRLKDFFKKHNLKGLVLAMIS